MIGYLQICTPGLPIVLFVLLLCTMIGSQLTEIAVLSPVLRDPGGFWRGLISITPYLAQGLGNDVGEGC